MQNEIKAQVFATVQVQGTHYYKGAPAEVAYLSLNHRHVFHFKCFKQVFHDDRDIEFIMLKNAIIEHFKASYEHLNGVYIFEHRSCEMLARELIERLGLTQCEVSEDGENGVVLWK